MKRILVVDDDHPVARLISAALKAAEIEHIIDYCSDGGQGKVKAGQGECDLITLDLAMPLMDGFAALEEMKRNPKCAHIPVIVITSHQDAEMHQRALDLGATAVLTKPFKPRQAAETLRRALMGEIEPGGMGPGLKPLGR